jgi:hypothetical protein
VVTRHGVAAGRRCHGAASLEGCHGIGGAGAVRSGGVRVLVLLTVETQVVVYTDSHRGAEENGSSLGIH